MPIPQTNVGDVLTSAYVNTWTIPQCAMKTLDQSVTNSTVLVNDTVLVLAVAASAQYVFDCYLNFEGAVAGSGQIQWQWTVPAAATMRYETFYVAGSFGAGANTQNAGIIEVTTTKLAGSNVSAGTQGAGVLCSAVMKGSLITGANAGNLQFQWAQLLTSATATIVHGQSYVKLDRVG